MRGMKLGLPFSDTKFFDTVCFRTPPIFHKKISFAYLMVLYRQNYVPPMKLGDILFLAPLSVRPSVCRSRFRVRSISFEPLVGFTNNFAQMSSMMRRCAVPMFDQGRFKVKGTI